MYSYLKNSSFAAVDLFCPPRVSVQDYCDKQHWEGEGTGKKQKKAFTGCKKVSFTAHHWGKLQLQSHTISYLESIFLNIVAVLVLPSPPSPESNVVVYSKESLIPGRL